MRIGVPREIKVHEYRVGLVPAGRPRARRRPAMRCSSRRAPATASASTTPSFAPRAQLSRRRAAEVFERADLIVKVKEPQPAECQMLRPGQVLFTYLHLAADPAQAQGLMKSGATAIAYETVTAPNGSLPLLTPMSEVAGPHVHPGRRREPAEGQRRLRCAARWRAGRPAGESGDPRRRCFRYSCGGDGCRHARRRHRGRPLGRRGCASCPRYSGRRCRPLTRPPRPSSGWCGMRTSWWARCWWPGPPPRSSSRAPWSGP